MFAANHNSPANDAVHLASAPPPHAAAEATQLPAEGCRPIPAQLDLIDSKQAPRTRKQLQKLMGLLNWLRSFIPHLATITAPMTDLLSPKSKLWWTTAAEQALTAVKQRFRECHNLSRLDPDEPIFVQTDASQEGMGAVLYQEGGDGERRVAEYASAKFCPAERRYHANKQECLAVVWAQGRLRTHPWAGEPAGRRAVPSPEPFNTVALDIMGPYPRTTWGKRFLVVTTDIFTRWSEAFAVSNVRAGTIVALLDSEAFPRYGYPKTLLTDNGTQFTGRRWAADCRRCGVEHHTTPTYHPRANPTERRNQDIKVQLRLRLGDDHSKWDVHLPKLLYCLRQLVNAVTGHSPVELFHGQNLALPGELRVAEGVPKGPHPKRTSLTCHVTSRPITLPPTHHHGHHIANITTPVTSSPSYITSHTTSHTTTHHLTRRHAGSEPAHHHS
ncbi:uncharacterized protein LOC134538105 [Bacillus rossius redtenbacheri]|uniref:uncharacterized protein LOC134538105 n=1 Tax=Bacillus rossius redtenbacheri TaxID=93214 RepID=UPI002FDE55B5